MPPVDATLGQGEEYELRAADARLVTDPKVLGWRLDEIRRQGFTPMQADALAKLADVDLHEVARLVAAAKAKGTPLDTVFDILS